jgi:hypothetical protein
MGYIKTTIMKKNIFFAICLLVAGSVSAQGYYYGPHRVVKRPAPRQNDFYKVRLGITGGVNFANTYNAFNANYNSSTNTIIGFNAGLTLDLPVVYPFSIAVEGLVSQKGFSAQTSDGNFTQRSYYIDVPILAKFKLSPTFNFLVGPQISFPISTTQTYDNGFNVTAQQQYNTTYDKTIVGGVIGVSFDLSPYVELRGRYTYDLQSNEENTTAGYNYRNQVWQVGLGFKFE